VTRHPQQRLERMHIRTGISSACISRNDPDLDRTLRRDGSHVVELPVDGPDVEHGVEQVNR
jgi:hypothetical protein